MRIVVDEDIPKELVPFFGAPGILVEHVEDIGLKGTKNGALLAARSGTCDILVTGDTNLGRQQNLLRYDLAIVLIHPRRLVVEQIAPLIEVAVAAFATAPRHAVTTIGVPISPLRRARVAAPKRGQAADR